MRLKSHIIVFLAITVILSVAKLKASFTILLADRFYDGLGWVQILIAAIIGVLLFRKTLTEKGYAKLRSQLWITFCVLFFVQFVMGIFLSDKFLLTGQLHIPAPFIIVAGAIYRGDINFMVVLYFVTILLTGGIWCSHLCYFGGFDLMSARASKRQMQLTISYRTIWLIKLTILIIILCGAFIMRYLDNHIYLIISISVIISIEIGMIILSRYRSKMIHCTLFCPIGTLTSILKIVNPLRVKIDSSQCTKCRKCVKECRYSALDDISISMSNVRLNCTHCGDCISGCSHNALYYKIWGLNRAHSRDVFKVILIIFYVVFLSVAMV